MESTSIREAVKEYMIDFLKERIIDRAFSGRETKDLAEVKTFIDQVFAKLNSEFEGKIQKPYINEND